MLAHSITAIIFALLGLWAVYLGRNDELKSDNLAMVGVEIMAKVVVQVVGWILVGIGAIIFLLGIFG